jgi:predicted RNase H-like nuclease (RuvC/YqgF family)
MMGQTISEHLNEGAESSKTAPAKHQRRAAALKIKKIIRRCKADTKTIKRLDDEQNELLERMRKHL